MRSQLFDSTEELALFLQRFGLKKKVNERKSLEENIRILKREMRQLDLVPGNTTAEKEKYINTISITVQETLFPGTEIQIGNATKTIHYARKKIRFSLEKQSDEFIESEL
jgi:uncharacterized protein (DUF342 family)